MNKLIAIGMLFVGMFVSANVSANEEYTLVLKREKRLGAKCDMSITMDSKEFILSNGQEITYTSYDKEFKMDVKWNCKVKSFNKLQPETYHYNIKFENKDTKYVNINHSLTGHILASNIQNTL